MWSLGGSKRRRGGGVVLGLGTKGKGEGPAGGAVTEGRLPAGQGPTCGPDRLGWSPVLSSAPLLSSLHQYNSTGHWSGAGCRPVQPCGHCVCAGESGIERRTLSHREREV